MRSSKCCHQSAHFSSVSYPVVACVNTWSQRKVAAPSDRGWKKKKNACNLYKCFHRVWKEHIVLIGSIIKQGAGFFFCVCVSSTSWQRRTTVISPHHIVPSVVSNICLIQYLVDSKVTVIYSAHVCIRGKTYSNHGKNNMSQTWYCKVFTAYINRLQCRSGSVGTFLSSSKPQKGMCLIKTRQECS